MICDANSTIVKRFCLFKQLPRETYLTIQQYLENKQYLFLMNASRVLFGDIKVETIRFNYIIDEGQAKLEYRSEPDRWGEEISLLYERFSMFINRVKSPSRQIKLTLRNALQENLLKYSKYFTNINGLEIQYPQKISDDFDFNIFNNIPKLGLNNWRGLIRIRKGLENIQELDICQCTDLISIECPLKSFDKLRIRYCDQIAYVSPIKQTKKISITTSHEIPLILPKNSDSLTILKITSRIDSLYLDEIPYRSLKILHLTNIRAKETDDFSIFAHIPELALENIPRNNKSDYYLPPFPKFQGRILYIGGFDLSSWNSPTEYGFENLRELTLCFGVKLPKFPVFPNLRRLFIYENSDFEEILSESFPNCITLHVNNCSSLVKIHQFPKIQSIVVSDCENFKEFIGSMNISNVTLRNLQSFENVLSLRNVHNLILNECSSIRSFAGFDRSDLPNSERKVRISHFNVGKCDLKGLGNIGLLTLCHIKDLKDGKGIHDIDDLILQGVYLKNFKRLQVRRSLILRSHNRIHSFAGLKTLLRIAILIEHPSFEASFKLSDLSYFNCDQFYCYQSLPWVTEAQEYVKDASSSSFAPIFQSMKAFYVVTDMDKYDHFLRHDEDLSFAWDAHMSKSRLW